MATIPLIPEQENPTKKLKQYPNQRLFDAIENFRKENKIKETGAVKPGHWTEVKINKELKKERMKNMKISSKGLSWLKDKEDKILDKQGNHILYNDQTGKPVNTHEPLPKGATIGYGHLIKNGEDFKNGISEAKVTELLRADIATAERAVRDNITVPLSQNQFDALTSLAYNIGSKNFANSTVVKYVNNPNFHSSVYPNLESAWKAWNRSQGEISNGLINRRQNEWNMYSRGIY
ncbi:MAG: lysozyme [Alphaproteobacteria bacterium]|nr:lysozyme [Alphaproteobacteria bacterium]